MNQRVDVIRDRVTSALQPQALEITDESHLHAGHPGARDGRGHFRLRIVSASFIGLSPLARHRRVHAALSDLLETDIHALSLSLLTPEEAGLGN